MLKVTSSENPVKPSFLATPLSFLREILEVMPTLLSSISGIMQQLSIIITMDNNLICKYSILVSGHEFGKTSMRIIHFLSVVI
jgi:hypothetical protein